jgi:hypothetical protein
MICVGGDVVVVGSVGVGNTVVGTTASVVVVPALPLLHDMPASNTPVTLMLTPPTRIRLAAAAWRRGLRRPRPVVGSVILVFGLVVVRLLGLVLVVARVLRRRGGRVG